MYMILLAAGGLEWSRDLQTPYLDWWRLTRKTLDPTKSVWSSEHIATDRENRGFCRLSERYVHVCTIQYLNTERHIKIKGAVP
jgi:hypothetical protein